MLSVRHRNRPGVLAHVFKVLAERSINVEEVENIIYHGAQATLARVHLGSSACIAVVLDTPGWSSISASARMQTNEAFRANMRVLSASGWRVSRWASTP